MFAVPIAPWLTRRGIHYGWVMVAATFLTAMSAAAAVGLPGLLLLPISQEFGWSRGEISWAMASMLLVFGAMAPFAGALMLRYGLRRVVASGAILTVAALTGTTPMTAKWQLWLCLGVVLGMAAGMTAMVLAATVANRWFVRRRGLVVGLLAAAAGTGQLMFLPLAAWIEAAHGWRMAMVPAIAGCAVSAVAYWLLAPDWPEEIGLTPYGEPAIGQAASRENDAPLGPAQNGGEIGVPLPSIPAARPGMTMENARDRPPGFAAVSLSLDILREAAGTRAFLAIAGTFFVCGLSTAGTMQQHFIPLCADHGVGAVRAASVLAAMGVFNFAGTVASGWLSDRIDARVLLAWYYGVRGIVLMWLPFSAFDVVSLSVFAVFFGLDFIATLPPTVKLAAQSFGPEASPIVFGWAFASHQLGGAVAAVAAGVSRDMLATYLPAFFGAGVACVLAALAMAALWAARRPAMGKSVTV